jgi:phytoene synthase
MYNRGFHSLLQYRHDRRHCRALLKAGSQSFFAASLLLPQRFRGPITALYAFCRVADDIIDAATVTDAALAELEARLDAIYAGHPQDDPVDRAFADVVHRFAIPRALPRALLEGFEWDTSGRRYAELTDVYAYAARVAGTVGAMMALLMGVRDAETLARACDLGVAMQLTNIARDVGEDAAAGRLYLPTRLLEEHGIDPESWLLAPQVTDGVRSVVQTLLDDAGILYQRADWGIAQLPGSCRPAMFAASAIYADIGNAIAANGYDSVTQRAWVRSPRKLRLLAAALANAPRAREPGSPQTLREVRFLVDAVAA